MGRSWLLLLCLPVVLSKTVTPVPTASNSYLVNPGPEPDEDPLDQEDDIKIRPGDDGPLRVTVNQNRRWPNGEVPYTFGSGLSKFIFVVVDDDFHLCR